MFSSSQFWLLIAAAFAIGQLIPASHVRARAGLLALTGALTLAIVLKLTPLAGAIIAVAFVSLVVACRRLAAGADAPLMLGLAAASPLVFAWIVGKAGVALDIGLLTPLLFVGLSYLVVKAWTLVKDVIDGKVREVDPAVLLAYMLHAPTFLVGPMHYFSEFKAQLTQPAAIDAEAAVDIAFRITLGLGKVMLASILTPASLSGLVDKPVLGVLELAQAAVIYSFVLYLDFSGACDMANGASRLLGVNLPENFRWPFLASSIREFWRCWHITFSRALTAHIFVPLTRSLQRRFPQNVAAVSTLGYLVTFLVCGYWHGATSNFLAWGVWHALGLIVQDAGARRRRKRGLPPLVKKDAWRIIRDTLATFAFVSAGWIFFVLPLDRLASIGAW